MVENWSKLWGKKHWNWLKRVFPGKYSEMPLISNFQKFHKLSLDVPKKILEPKNPPPPLPSPEYWKNIFLGKKFLFTRIWGKIMILIEMFRETNGLSTQIFTKFLTRKGGGWDTGKRKLRIATATGPYEGT